MSSAQHRRIDVQSPADLLHLQNALTARARSKIDLHLPPQAQRRPTGTEAASTSTHNTDNAANNNNTNNITNEDDDPLRTTVSHLVQTYIRETYALALPSISINGLPAPSTALTTREESAFEPYNPLLAKRLQALSAAIEDETLKLAEMRRTAPKRAAEMYVARQGALREREEAGLRAQEEMGAKIPGARVEGGQKESGEREQETAQAWEDALQGVRSLKDELPGLRAKLERAETGVGILETPSSS